MESHTYAVYPKKYSHKYRLVFWWLSVVQFTHIRQDWFTRNHEISQFVTGTTLMIVGKWLTRILKNQFSNPQ